MSPHVTPSPNSYRVVTPDCRSCLSTASNRGMSMRDFGSVPNLYATEYAKRYFKPVYLRLIHGKSEVCSHRRLLDIIALASVSICHLHNAATSRPAFTGFFAGVERGTFDSWHIPNAFVSSALHTSNVRIFPSSYAFTT